MIWASGVDSVMKRCPKCRRLFTNELLKFCRFDGAELVDPATISAEALTLRLARTNDSDRVERRSDSASASRRAVPKRTI